MGQRIKSAKLELLNGSQVVKEIDCDNDRQKANSHLPVQEVRRYQPGCYRIQRRSFDFRNVGIPY
jgi:hypothetical protein